MMKFLCAVLILALLSSEAAQARVDLSPEQYRSWRAYDSWRIRIVEFPGLESFARGDLLLVMATEKPNWTRRYLPLGSRPIFDSEEFAKDLFRIERFYQREGFPDAMIRGVVVPDEKKSELLIRFEILEGPPLILASWRMVVDSAHWADSARWSKLLPIKIGKRLALSDVFVSADTLAYKLRQDGFARARVEPEIVSDSARYRADLTFHLHHGNYNTLGGTIVTGLKQFSEGTIRRERAYKGSEPYHPQKIQDTRENIYRLQGFSMVTVRADTSVEGDILPVRIDVVESRRYRVKAGVRYDTQTYEGVHAQFEDLNFFGRGRRLTWTNEVNRLLQSSEMRLFWPHTPWQVTDVILAPKWEYRRQQNNHHDDVLRVDTRTNTTILTAKPMRKVTASVSNEFGSEIVKARVANGDQLTEDWTRQRLLKSVETFSISWDTRDNALIPRAGHFIAGTFSESGAFYPTDQQWWRAVFNTSVIRSIARFTSIASRSEFGVMGPLGNSNTSPIQERFFFYGGAANVRGWGLDKLSPRSADDPEILVGGDIAFSATAEIRQNIWGPVTLAAFTDVGNVWRLVDEMKILDLYPSVGAGLLFLTPVGPIRIDYARQVRRNPFNYRGADLGAVHFSVGTPF